MIRVLLADDHGAVRSGLALILNNAPDIEVVGEAADGATAERMVRATTPDVVLMDVRMPGTDGIAATRAIVSAGLCRVLILTTFDMDEYVFGALRAGASGFLLKSVDAAHLVDAVRTVAAGDAIIEPGITRRLLSTFAAAEPPQPPAGLGELTDRERDVLGCIGNGLSNAQISTELHITEATVKTHVSRILTKLDLQSRVQAAILARELGVV